MTAPAATDLVTVTIDERTVQVPKGTGMVETAAAAGIEIPVFCYEPRLGAPVGACRMCLVEVEGIPKLQAGCTLTAQDGMVVKTARTSEQAAEGQNSTLEFILVNHPLDCPVCDKGGECPLQDLTFRYGPGNTRMTFPKRTFEKPIPISPLIALDRERCILCYRCTRFSESVAEDGKLVAINRGAQSVIATFEDEPYLGHFSGNVTELCPVGALTSTQYRFEARPWEIQNVPTVCGLCPVGCNTAATTREGNVKRILSRNHPEVDEGWLCDKGRFAFDHLQAADRITTPLRKAGPRRFEQLSWEDALDQAESLLRDGGATTVTALSGNESVEEAYALAKLMRQGLSADSAVLPEEVPDALDSYRAPLSALRDAKTIAVYCDEPVVERAPIVELWLKSARRKGATITYGAPDGPVDALVTDQPDVTFGAGEVYYLPRTPNGRGVTDAWSAAGDGEPVDGKPRVVVISGDEAATDPAVRAMAAEAEIVIGIGMFQESFRGIADLVLPGTSYLERDGTTINLEGRLQRCSHRCRTCSPGSQSSLRASTSSSRRTPRTSSTRSRGSASAASPTPTSASAPSCRLRPHAQRAQSARKLPTTRPRPRALRKHFAWSLTGPCSPALRWIGRPSCSSSARRVTYRSRARTRRHAASATARR
jgi:NADH dehydrogenase/NADH:ubiquinone oxidoreductase subunit G